MLVLNRAGEPPACSGHQALGLISAAAMRTIVLLAAAAFALCAAGANALRQPNPGKGALAHAHERSHCTPAVLAPATEQAVAAPAFPRLPTFPALLQGVIALRRHSYTSRCAEMTSGHTATSAWRTAQMCSLPIRGRVGNARLTTEVRLVPMSSLLNQPLLFCSSAAPLHDLWCWCHIRSVSFA